MYNKHRDIKAEHPLYMCLFFLPQQNSDKTATHHCIAMSMSTKEHGAYIMQVGIREYRN